MPYFVERTHHFLLQSHVLRTTICATSHSRSRVVPFPVTCTIPLTHVSDPLFLRFRLFIYLFVCLFSLLFLLLHRHQSTQICLTRKRCNRTAVGAAERARRNLPFAEETCSRALDLRPANVYQTCLSDNTIDSQLLFLLFFDMVLRKPNVCASLLSLSCALSRFI